MQTFYAVFANPTQAHDAEAALKKAGLPEQNLKIVADTSDLNEEANLSAAASFAWAGDQSAAGVAGGMDITGGGGLFARGGVGAGGGTISGGASSPLLNDATLISEAKDEDRVDANKTASQVTMMVSTADDKIVQTEVRQILDAYGAQVWRRNSTE